MSQDLFVTLPSGCRICYNVIGNPSDPTILLISGHSTSMTQKTDGILGFLNTPENPHCIVRFDHRDTGLSTSFPTPPGDATDPVYSLSDMSDDVVGLVKHLGLKAVHLVGVSLGGPIAWQAATRLPEETRSLALALTSPVGRQQIPTDNLPPLHLEGQYLLGEAYEPPNDPNDDAGWIEAYDKLSLCLSSQPPTEEEKLESNRESEVTYYREKESGTMWTKINHSGASGPRWPRELLKHIKCPTVIIHGEKDQIFPVQHAEALRGDVEGAMLVVLEGCGHEVPHRVRQKMADAILANIKRTSETLTA
ncbi:Alpha/Beta hydrolase protein [Stachybotrys elegans]|uniref:Alpha/Beta hydrolase protein n=1 Tax=Stachybotrys elegans TaxID=80388 RepID=A0A8K0SGW4_9HYPO|nr:Alpha/Beta hydrolase protein [Stachybotrys elegans]